MQINFTIKSKMIFILISSIIILSGCNKKPQEPVDVVKSFILLCEEGKMDDASKLLAPKNNVDYFRTYKDKGKDMLYIDHDYKGNDDVIELTFKPLKDLSSDEIAVIKMTSNYKKQHHSFDKDIVLHKIDGQWKIFEYLFMPVNPNVPKSDN